MRCPSWHIFAMARLEPDPAQAMDSWLLQLLETTSKSFPSSPWYQQLHSAHTQQSKALEIVAAQPPASETVGLTWADSLQHEGSGPFYPLQKQAQAWAFLLEASTPSMHVPFLLDVFEDFWQQGASAQNMALCLHTLASCLNETSSIHVGDLLSTVVLLKLSTSRFFLDSLLIATDALEPRGLGALAAMQHLIDTLLQILTTDEDIFKGQLRQIGTTLDISHIAWCACAQPATGFQTFKLWLLPHARLDSFSGRRLRDLGWSAH